jgi:hypothetical protein
VNFCKNVRKTSVKNTIRNTHWWPQFIKWARENNIQVRAYVVKLTMVIEEIRQKHGKAFSLHKYIVKLPKDKWEKLRENLQAGRFWDMVKKFKARISLASLWKKFLKHGVRKGLQRSHWWVQFVAFFKSQGLPIQNLYQDFRNKFRIVLRKLLNKKKWVPKRSFRITWKRSKYLIANTKFWQYLKTFTSENKYEINEFMNNVKNFGVKQGLSKISWWNEFEEFLKKQGVEIDSIIVAVEKIVKKFRKAGK